VTIHGAKTCDAAPCDRLRAKMPLRPAPEMFAIFAKFAKFAKFAVFNP
jgi:hypothetical protein